jgi:hypothetical protein
MRLCELLQFRAPSGTADVICSLAEQEGVSASEFMRRAILADVEEHTREERPCPDHASGSENAARDRFTRNATA